jgi:diaminohydroxyphosphoribosylaminopyrimidine deaminase/5-amino-6-(5-phosphoribosylamino)uracil reductase
MPSSVWIVSSIVVVTCQVGCAFHSQFFAASHLCRSPTTSWPLATNTRPSSSTLILEALSSNDEQFLQLAVDCAKHGLGHTFPNPAVGCVLVRQDTNEVIGKGFHPRTGYPHAEVFALLEAAKHVDDGVDSAKAIVLNNDSSLVGRVRDLAAQYAASDGPETLFGDCFDSMGTKITVYVTLEPCCHFGKTPPCATSLVLARASRVVVGFRDPNPRVDGGGVKVLIDAGVDVEMAEGSISKACSDLVADFCKRITPRPEIADYSFVNGAMRSALRSLAARKKQEGRLAEASWGGDALVIDEDDGHLNEAIDALSVSPEWMEHIDALLWTHEIILLRLNKAVQKKRLAQRLGQRIATELEAHVAQTVGHTVLLYRPGIPAKLDLKTLIER